MSKSFKRLLSSVLAFVMAVTCLTVVNVGSVFAADTVITYSVADKDSWSVSGNTGSIGDYDDSKSYYPVNKGTYKIASDYTNSSKYVLTYTTVSGDRLTGTTDGTTAFVPQGKMKVDQSKYATDNERYFGITEVPDGASISVTLVPVVEDGSIAASTLGYVYTDPSTAKLTTTTADTVDTAGSSDSQTLTISNIQSTDSNNGVWFGITTADKVSITSITLTIPGTTTTDTYSITGVVSYNGTGINGLTVTAGGKSATTETVGDTAGQYTINGLTAGKYTVSFAGDSTYSEANSSEVTISDSDVTSGADITLSLASGSTTTDGYVTVNATGNTEYIMNTSDKNISDAITAANSDNEYSANNMTFNVAETNKTEVRLKPASTITFKVKEACKLVATFNNHELKISSDDTATTKLSQTLAVSESGSTVISLEPNVVYTLSGGSSNLSDNTKLTKLTFTKDTTVTTTYSVTGEITDSLGADLSGAKVTVTDGDGNAVSGATVSVSGNVYTVSGLTALTDDATYVIKATLDNYEAGSITLDKDTLTGDLTKDIVLTAKSTTEATDTYFTVDNRSALLGSTIQGIDPVSATDSCKATFTDAIFSDGTGSISGKKFVKISSSNLITPSKSGTLKLYIVGTNDSDNTSFKVTDTSNNSIVTENNAVTTLYSKKTTSPTVPYIPITVEASHSYKVSASVQLYKAIFEGTEETPVGEEGGTVKVLITNHSTKATSVDATVSIGTSSKLTSVKLDEEVTIGKATDGQKVTFLFDSDETKHITNWASPLTSTTTKRQLVYTATGEDVTLTMDYYDEMPGGQTFNTADANSTIGYGTYGFGQYKNKVCASNLAANAEIKGHLYSLADVNSGSYDKDGLTAKYNYVPDERILLTSDDTDYVKVTINPTLNKETSLIQVQLDCSGKDAIVTTNSTGTIYTDAAGTTAAKLDDGDPGIQGTSVSQGAKLTFYVTGNTTLTIKGSDPDSYSVIKSLRVFSTENIVVATGKGTTVTPLGTLSILGSAVQSAIGLDTTKYADYKIYLISGKVPGDHNDTDEGGFMKNIANVGYTFFTYDSSFAGKAPSEFGTAGSESPGATIAASAIPVEITNVYKNVMSLDGYEADKDDTTGYTGKNKLFTDAEQDESYFGFVVAVDPSKQFMGYAFTTYASATNTKVYDTTNYVLLNVE